MIIIQWYKKPSTFTTKNWVEVNVISRRRYSANSQIKFKTLMLNSNLCDYSVACILFKDAITFTGDARPGYIAAT